MENKKYFILFQSLGDNLISLYLLSQLDEKVNILGTRHTKNVAKLMRVEDKFDIKVVFDDIPSFYNIKKDGVVRAANDILKFRKYLKQNNIKEIIFEKDDFRAKLLTFGISKYHASNVTKHAYINRKNLFEKVLSCTIKLKPSIKPGKNINKILISPVSKVRARNISKEILEIILSILSNHNYTIQLIDYTKEYKEFKNKVNEYYTDTTLEDAKDLIFNSDFFIGTDSFLIHLAYYFDKPFFIIFNYEYYDFLPPCCDAVSNYIITIQEKNREKGFRNKFFNLGIIN